MAARDIDRAAARQRALDHWHAAPEDVRRAGEAWYPVIAGRAIALDPSRTPDSILSAMAVLSPRVRVASNLRDLETLITGRRWVTRAFGENVRKARAILDDGATLDDVVKRAPKVRAFKANLCGDEQAVTVDTWMRTVLDGIEHGAGRGKGISPAEYKVYADILRECADKVGVSPRTFQATVWIAARRNAD